MRRVRFALVFLVALTAAGAAAARELRVCADPRNLPFSNREGGGFENRIAALLAADLGADLTYYWLSQHRGFMRRTIQANECDVVMGVPTGWPTLATSKPYYRSSYAFVTPSGQGGAPSSFDDPALGNLRIGLQALGAEGANTPPAQALARRGLFQHVVGYPMWGESSIADPSGVIVDAVAKREIDVAIVWGPFAGYFAKRHADTLQVAPVLADPADPALAFAYDMSVGVRKKDTELLTQIDAVLDRRGPEIRAILLDYGVPLVEKDDGASTP